MQLRRSAKNIETTLRALDKQRQSYYIIGKAAARNGSHDKVRMVAKALQHCNALEARMTATLTAIELMQTHGGIATAQQQFVTAMGDMRGLMNGLDLPRAAAEFDLSMQAAQATETDLQVLTEDLMTGNTGLSGSLTESSELAALEAELNGALKPAAAKPEAALAPAPASPAPQAPAAPTIDDDLKQLERELNLAV
jgi:hypothetical protein